MSTSLLDPAPDTPVAGLVDGRDWRRASALEMVGHLRSRYHDRLRTLLPELVRLAQRVEVVHAAHAACPHGLAEQLLSLQESLEQHMRKEERVLFPQLQVTAAAQLGTLIEPLRSNLAAQQEALQRISGTAHGLALPADACGSWQALVQGLHALRADLLECIHLKNELLYAGANAPMTAGCSAGGGGCACAGTAG